VPDAPTLIAAMPEAKQGPFNLVYLSLLPNARDIVEFHEISNEARAEAMVGFIAMHGAFAAVHPDAVVHAYGYDEALDALKTLIGEEVEDRLASGKAEFERGQAKQAAKEHLRAMSASICATVSFIREAADEFAGGKKAWARGKRG
jgi:uncharacterized small protein (DUF1192 family)